MFSTRFNNLFIICSDTLYFCLYVTVFNVVCCQFFVCGKVLNSIYIQTHFKLSAADAFKNIVKTLSSFCHNVLSLFNNYIFIHIDFPYICQDVLTYQEKR